MAYSNCRPVRVNWRSGFFRTVLAGQLRAYTPFSQASTVSLSLCSGSSEWTFWTLNKPQQHPPCYWQVLRSHGAGNFALWRQRGIQTLVPVVRSPSFSSPRCTITKGKRRDCSQSTTGDNWRSMVNGGHIRRMYGNYAVSRICTEMQ